MNSKSDAITAERLRELLLYDPETGMFTNRCRRGNKAHAGAIAGFISKGYRRLCIDGALVLAHRAVWCYVTGSWPTNQLDHIDRDKLNNRISNLRNATNSVNQQNRLRARTDNAIGLLGVSKSTSRRTKPWLAKIQGNGHQRFIGYFSTPEEAHEAYLSAKARYHQGAVID